jgi:hypothetical protein
LQSVDSERGMAGILEVQGELFVKGFTDMGRKLLQVPADRCRDDDLTNRQDPASRR